MWWTRGFGLKPRRGTFEEPTPPRHVPVPSDVIPNTKVLGRTAIPSVSTFQETAQARTRRQSARLRLPKLMLYSEFCQAKRTVERQTKRFKEYLKTSLLKVATPNCLREP
ncbi:hypothetical protein ElyMa_002421200 [Elysia marginata]|uniref:Uncharacterized protein n=1 Tax=Elysia marginata TaxID=1093978 RepID=A0AAV4GH75_9GAST|nr:hypothetical protein ElyMa_002421200 [Elysia marginata]